MGIGFYVVLWIIQGIICGCFCSKLAVAKGFLDGEQEIQPDHATSWAMAGFFFGIFALIAAAGLPDRRAHPCDNENRSPSE